MTYEQVLNWLYNRLPVYQNIGKKALKYKLDNISAFMNYLGNPHQNFKSIHIAGTNGKGSSAHMLSSILTSQNLKIGLYTSPHLKQFEERIKVNGVCIEKTAVSNFLLTHKEFIEQRSLSFFELTVALGFHYFSKKKVDYAIIETGLGGRLDSTNIITPDVCLITNIGYDHMNILGDSLVEIAKEKAGIIKQNTPCVLSEYQEDVFNVFENRAKKVNATLISPTIDYAKKYSCSLVGDYQKKNINGVVEVIKILPENISEQTIQKGLMNVVKNTNLRGRWEVRQLHNPKIVFDVAHNLPSLMVTLSQVKKEHFDKLHLVMGFVKDKALEDVFKILPKEAIYYFSKLKIFRTEGKSEIVNLAKLNSLNFRYFEESKEALQSANLANNKDDFIFVCGSNFIVSELL